MNLIDNVDLELAFAGTETDLLAQIAYVVDAVVAGCVDFDEIEHAPFIDGDAGGTFVTGTLALGSAAVEGLGQDAGRTGLARAPGPGKEVGVRDAPIAQGIAQGLGHMFLADNLVKGLAAPFAVEGLRHGVGSGIDRHQDSRISVLV